MTPDGSKVVMAIGHLIVPNNHDSSQTAKIFVKDLVTGSLTLIDDGDHSTGHSREPGSRTTAGGFYSPPIRAV